MCPLLWQDGAPNAKKQAHTAMLELRLLCPGARSGSVIGKVGASLAPKHEASLAQLSLADAPASARHGIQAGMIKATPTSSRSPGM